MPFYMREYMTKLNLIYGKIETKQNTFHFTLNNEEYYYNVKTTFIYKKDNKNKYSYVSNFDPTIKSMIKKQYESFIKYNKI